MCPGVDTDSRTPLLSLMDVLLVLLLFIVVVVIILSSPFHIKHIKLFFSYVLRMYRLYTLAGAALPCCTAAAAAAAVVLFGDGDDDDDDDDDDDGHERVHSTVKTK
jgi:hypothetical protein